MSDFMQKQIEASHNLYRLMMKDHEERLQLMDRYAAMQSEFASQLAEKDRKIAKLEATIAALHVLGAGNEGS